MVNRKRERPAADLVVCISTIHEGEGTYVDATSTCATTQA
jgi:hypothetical protein